MTQTTRPHCTYPGCRAPVEPGGEYCIFHEPGPKDLEAFQNALNDQIKGAGGTGGHPFNFKGYVFPASIEVQPIVRMQPWVQLPTEFFGDVCFDNSIIEGSVSLNSIVVEGGISFNDALIKGALDLSCAKIKGDALLNRTTIHRQARFEGTEVSGNCLFNDATLGGDLSFLDAAVKMDFWCNRATIKGFTLFGNAETGAVRFEDASVGGLFFVNARIGRYAKFDGIRVRGISHFDRLALAGEATFEKAAFNGIATFDGATFAGNASFKNAKFKKPLSFCSSTINGYARFLDARIGSGATFSGAVCRDLQLGEDLPRTRGRGVKRCGIVIAKAESAVSFWRFAQRAYARSGEREKADAAFYFERLNRWRVLRRSAADEEAGHIRGVWRTGPRRFAYWLLFLLDLVFIRWTTAYGASIARLFSTWFVVIAGFGATYSLAPWLIGRADVYRWTLRNWVIGFHYSVTTFATLGLGDVKPGESSLGMVLTLLEAILGAILVALAVLVIGRRLMRQG